MPAQKSKGAVDDMGLHVVELKGRAAYTRNSAPGCHFAGSLSGL